MRCGGITGQSHKVVAIGQLPGIIALTLQPGDARRTGEPALVTEGSTGMTNTMMMDRTGMGMQGMGMPGMAPSTVGTPTGMPVGPNYLMVPRCTMKMEKISGGMKITCSCDDPMACSMMQNLCMMLQGGMCSLCCMMNGMIVCGCNLTMGMCKCDMTKDGCVITCTSGDAECCSMIQA